MLLKSTWVLFLLETVVHLLSATRLERRVKDIRDCPHLNPRVRPHSVHDLRPDDIKVIGALGDSVTAGFGIKGLDDILINKTSPEYSIRFREYRGLSYIMGGDNGALSLANYFRHYQPKLKGYSTGEHSPESCNYDKCDTPYIPKLDALNAAQSGATAYNLDHELTYLIDEMKKIKGIDFQNDWKMINIQIGSNDMCYSCKPNSPNDAEKSMPENFEKYIEVTLDKIQSSIPKVLVNIYSSYNVSQVITSTEGEPYCNSTGSIPNRSECDCAVNDAGLRKMQHLFIEYDKRLISIYKRRQKKKSDTFAVVFQPHNVNFDSCPPEYYSNQDCFHPGLVGHNFLSKSIWNQLFVPQASKSKVLNFDYKEPIYCPSSSDRIMTN